MPRENQVSCCIGGGQFYLNKFHNRPCTQLQYLPNPLYLRILGAIFGRYFFNASGVENSLEFSFFEYLWNLGEIVQVVKGKIVMGHTYAF